MGWYKHWFGTPWYALLYGHRDENEANAWVEALIGKWGDASGWEVLDMACGRGRHARGFAAVGAKVTGIDISIESIEAARKAVPEAEFQVHDMREPFAVSRFDAAYCLFTSLGYFDDLNDDRKVFAAAFTALKPGGRFVVDFMNSPLVIASLVPEEKVTREGVEFNIARTVEEDRIIKRIMVRSGGSEYEFEEKVQALLPEQLMELATDTGFEIVDRTDGPQPSPFDPDRSQRFVLWMKKPIG